MKYYVLGTKNNQMLEGYLDKYYAKLTQDLAELSQYLLKSEEEIETRLGESIQKLLEQGIQNRDFILDGDNSSISNLLYLEYVQNRSQGLGSKEFYIEKWNTEIELHLSGEFSKLTMNQGSEIAGTNIKLSMVDNNPYGQLDAHPDHKNNGGVQGWGEKSEREWLEVYEKTFTLLKNTDEGVYEELNKIITKIVPLGTAYGLHNSASYKECIGHLYMGFTIDSDQPELNNLEAIIHESSHNKLNVIKQFDSLTLNSFELRYYSPYRPDARHISGIYLGIHAFVPVIYILMKAFLEGHISDTGHWKDKIVLYYLKNKFALKVLHKHADLTLLGKEILDEIEEVMRMTDDVFKKLDVEKEVIVNAKNSLIHHFQNVNANYPQLEY